ncbi:hypothetical protein BASA83_011296 [Batrachochytrium salamandrivorans]|nr:hypothetical protein BASA83_011296 [Batrachochytrium salamandrivorans]
MMPLFWIDQASKDSMVDIQMLISGHDHDLRMDSGYSYDAIDAKDLPVQQRHEQQPSLLVFLSLQSRFRIITPLPIHSIQNMWFHLLLLKLESLLLNYKAC